MKPEALRAEHLSYSYGDGADIFRDLNFTLREGEIFSILGPNGSGKSTLLNCLANLLQPRQGRVLLYHTPLRELSAVEIAKRISYVPQIHHPAYSYLVRDYVVMGRAPYLDLLQVPDESDYDLADQILEEMRLGSLADKDYGRLSGGERQQVQIARALVQQSRIMLLDEPTNHLDYGNQQRILELLAKLARQGYAIVMTTHMPDHPLLLGGKVGLMMKDAFLVGDAEKMIEQKTLRELYQIDLDLVYVAEIGRKACFNRSIRPPVDPGFKG